MRPRPRRVCISHRGWLCGVYNPCRAFSAVSVPPGRSRCSCAVAYSCRVVSKALSLGARCRPYEEDESRDNHRAAARTPGRRRGTAPTGPEEPPVRRVRTGETCVRVSARERDVWRSGRADPAGARHPRAPTARVEGRPLRRHLSRTRRAHGSADCRGRLGHSGGSAARRGRALRVAISSQTTAPQANQHAGGRRLRVRAHAWRQTSWSGWRTDQAQQERGGQP